MSEQPGSKSTAEKPNLSLENERTEDAQIPKTRAQLASENAKTFK